MAVFTNSIRIVMVAALAVGATLATALPSYAELDGAVVSTASGGINVRSGPATDTKAVGTIDRGENPTVYCKARGEHVEGHVRGSSTWLRIGTNRWIANGYITWSGEPPIIPWCAEKSKAATAAQVTTGGEDLNVRATAASGGTHQGVYRDGATINVQCQVWGQEVDGAHKSSVWYKIGPDRYVTASYIKWSDGLPWLPWCGQDPPTVPRGGNEGFIESHASAAQSSDEATGVPASVTLAQAILESGWGKGALAREDHNIFGMKCFGSPGEYAIGCRDYGTFECSPTGGCFDMDAEFRAYDNVTDSYRDHGELLSGWSRYDKAMDASGDPKLFAQEIHKAGYATDPKYAEKLIDLMDQYDLYSYDV